MTYAWKWTVGPDLWLSFCLHLGLLCLHYLIHFLVTSYSQIWKAHFSVPGTVTQDCHRDRNKMQTLFTKSPNSWEKYHIQNDAWEAGKYRVKILPNRQGGKSHLSLTSKGRNDWRLKVSDIIKSWFYLIYFQMTVTEVQLKLNVSLPFSSSYILRWL